MATDFADSVAFLYTGPDAIQTGVAAGAIEPARAAVIRGRVFRPGGAPLGGVTVRVVGHPELGRTNTRTDGLFDLVVNGGGRLTVETSRAGFLPVQRSVDVPVHASVFADDAVLTRLDLAVTPVRLDPADPMPLQVARGSVVSDGDGARRATLLFPSGTSAQAVMPDGSRVPLPTLSVRATEYTVGAAGPERMPGPLPPASGYTYAVELSADEAMTAGARGVELGAPIPFYLENFLGLPVGVRVPVGFYDMDTAQWMPSDDGVVLEIVSVAGGVAEIDADGDGVADAPAALAAAHGIDDEERVALAGLYAPGDTLWRAPVAHFSPMDLNFPIGLPAGAEAWSLDPETESGRGNPIERPDCLRGSVIECQNQVLRESIPLAGTDLRLHYRSDRVPGHLASRRLDVPITGSEVPPPLRRVELDVAIAGQRFREVFDPDPDQTHTIVWDGRDAYDRAVQGGARAVVRIGYVYDAEYQEPDVLGRSFGAVPGAGLGIIGGARLELVVWRGYVTTVGAWTESGRSLGGWSLSAHHRYDPNQRVLHRGDGARRRVADVSRVIEAFAGSGVFGDAGDGGPALDAELRPEALAAAPDASVYVATGNLGQTVRRIRPDGVIERFAGGGPTPADDVPAVQSSVSGPQGVAVGADGSVFIAQHRLLGNRVRRVDPSGIIRAFAGSGAAASESPLGDGGPAVDAAFGNPLGLDVGPDGSVYIADSLDFRVRRVAPDGTISTFAGTGQSPGLGPIADGVPATTADVFAFDVAVRDDGSIYIAGQTHVRRVGPDGIIHTVAGGGSPADGLGDGGPATGAQLAGANHVAIGPDGSLYLSHDTIGTGGTRDTRIRRIDPSGTITTVAGSGSFGFSGNDGPALRADLGEIRGLAVGPDGTLYVSEVVTAPFLSGRVRAIRLPVPAIAAGELAIPSRDGAEIFVFDEDGRHLRTLEARTSGVRLRFEYDAAGRLVGILDADGNRTQIERGPAGAPQAVVAPFGQRTALVLDADDLLERVIDPGGGTFSLGYHPGGLLRMLERPRGFASSYRYDAEGRLARDTDAVGGFTALARGDTPMGFGITTRSALGRVRSKSVAFLPGGSRLRSNVDAAGLVTRVARGADASETTSSPDGMVVEELDGADPRFGMGAPLPELVRITTPGGLRFEAGWQRAVTLRPEDGRLETQTDVLTRNGRDTVIVFDAATGERRRTSPEGRERLERLDARGRTTARDPDGSGPLAPVVLDYDARGRLAVITRGTGLAARVVTFDFDPAEGTLTQVTDPEGRVTRLVRDALGRVRQIVRPDLETITISRDANGNVESVTPPGRPAHQIVRDAIDSEILRTPPAVGPFDPSTAIEWTLDRQLDRIVRPDGGVIDFGYDVAGRPSSLALAPGGTWQLEREPLAGRLAAILAPDGGAIRFTYDGSLPRSTTWEGSVSGSVEVAYDDDLRVASRTVNGAQAIAHGYDGDGLLETAGPLSLVRHPDHGLVTGTTLGAVSTTALYDQFGELVSDEARVGGLLLHAEQVTARDRLGRIRARAETIQGVTTTYDYGYDAAGRLDTVHVDGVLAADFDYDANGNRLRDAAGPPAAAYDAQDRLLQYGPVTYAHGEAGELAVRTDTATGAVTTYTYDLLGHLTEVVQPDGTRIEYLIDGAGRRIGRRVDGVLTQGLLYKDGLNPVAELDDGNSIVSRFVYGTRAHVPDLMIRGGTTYRILSDHLGSVRLVVDASTGAVAQRLDYDAFGRVTQDTNPGFQPFGFAGGLYDPATGLVRFGARDYDPEVGRFTAQDPLRFLGGDTNLYTYAANDPVNRLDVDGQAFSFAAAGAGALVGATGGLAFETTRQLFQTVETGSLSSFDSGEVFEATLIGGVGGYVSGAIGSLFLGDPSASLAGALLGAEAAGLTTGLLAEVLDDVFGGEESAGKGCAGG